MDMLCMSFFCAAINKSLTDFTYKGKSHANLWTRVRSAIQFLDCFPEKRRKDQFDFPKYSSGGRTHILTYEQLVAAQNFFEDPENKKMLLRTKRKLPKILNLKLSFAKRRAAAQYCIELFFNLGLLYHYYHEYPPNFGLPKGLEKLLNPPKSKEKKGTG
jgi:hypothetical protein